MVNKLCDVEIVKTGLNQRELFYNEENVQNIIKHVSDKSNKLVVNKLNELNYVDWNGKTLSSLLSVIDGKYYNNSYMSGGGKLPLFELSDEQDHFVLHAGKCRLTQALNNELKEELVNEVKNYLETGLVPSEYTVSEARKELNKRLYSKVLLRLWITVMIIPLLFVILYIITGSDEFIDGLIVTGWICILLGLFLAKCTKIEWTNEGLI